MTGTYLYLSSDFLILPFLSITYIYLCINSFFKFLFKKLFLLNNSLKNNITINYNLFYENKYSSIIVYFFNLILINSLLLFILFTLYNGYCLNTIFSSFHLNNLILKYLKGVTVSMFFFFFILKKNSSSIKNYELVVGYYLFFFCIFYYLLLNNLLSLIIIFEFQSIIFIYILSNLFFLKNNDYLNSKKSFKNSNWYFLSLLYQFWVSFFGAIILFYSIIYILKYMYFIDWINLEVFIYFYDLIFTFSKSSEIIFILLPLFLGILLKLGILPFFFWKPEIYKNFNLDILFIYMTFYIFYILYFIIFFLSNYFFLINKFFFYYIYIIVIFTLIFLPIVFYSIVEVRVFFAYTSIFHIVIILSSLMYDTLYYSSSYIYLITYLYFSIFLLLLLYFISNFNLWFFTEFQYFLKYNIINIALFNIFLGMAGIPPFFGFFSKILIISLLILKNNYFLFILFFISSLLLAFYYIQSYRFFGYNLKSINFVKNNFLIKLNYNYLTLLIIFIFINNLSFFFFNDLFIFSFFFNLN